MASTVEFSNKEIEIIGFVAEKDEWDPEELKRRIMVVMFDGTGFQQALIQVLRNASRPEELIIDDPAANNILERVKKMREEAEANFARMTGGDK